MPDGPVRSEIRTRNQDVAVEAMMRIAVHRPRLRVSRPEAVKFSVLSVGLPEWGVDRVTFDGVRYRSIVEPSETLIAGVWRGGHGTMRTGDEDFGMGIGDGFVYPLGRTLDFENFDPDKALVRLPAAFVADLAEELTGLPAG